MSPRVALAAVLLAWPAAAGILIEATFEGVPVRVELGAAPDRAMVTMGGKRELVELRPVTVPPGYRLTPWSPGPVIAGYGTTYNVLTRDASICGEVLAATWMTPFLEPAAQALSQLQQREGKLAPTAREGCGAMPFGLFARNGWPLMAGWKDSPVFETRLLRFDHEASAELDIAGPAPSRTSD